MGRFGEPHTLQKPGLYRGAGMVECGSLVGRVKAAAQIALIDDLRHSLDEAKRLLPERLAELDPAYALLPADTRVPDHTIWHHADTATAMLPADTGSGASFLSFALAPVQTFIAAARSLRDLWSGSLILSWLTFEALLPVIEDLGPAAVIFPYLRGNPMLDVWLRRKPALDRLISEPDQRARAAPSLPNRFLAVVPTGSGGQEAQALERSDLLGAITDHGNGQCLHWREPGSGCERRRGHCTRHRLVPDR
jgi:hypothetical protein